MAKDVAIRVMNLCKSYQIYETPRDRLKQFVLPRLQQMAGQPVRRYYREFRALDDVSFDVMKGETVGIIGRNGSGKSTLLQIICGTLSPTGGSVETRGRIAALLELGSGFNPEFTGRENVYLNGSVLGLGEDEVDARFDDIAAFADIGEFIDHPVKTYSSGMTVRLAFAVAINVEPQILIVDEALSVGDEIFQRKCFSRIEAIKNNGATILFVSHSGSTVVELCDHAVLLDAGEKLAMGDPKRMVGQYSRLIYAPHEKKAGIRREILESDKSSLGYSTSQLFGLEGAEETNVEPEEFFDPNLVPKSTLEYESHGVRIVGPEIRNSAGEKVNCLKRGNRYLYTYKVRFDQPATQLRFGMLIKTTSGMELGGAVSACEGQGIPYQPSGTLIQVEFRFTCSLNPGTYFLNAGVMGVNSDVEAHTYLHRVLDICMFKVMPIANDVATATVDFNCVPGVVSVDDPAVSLVGKT